jgi:hypothetical protein
MAELINNACQSVKLYLWQRGPIKPRSPKRQQQDLSSWLEDPKKALLKAWKDR